MQPSALSRSSSVVFGESAEGRPLRAKRLASVRAPVGRVLVMAGQHGDEALAMEAADDLGPHSELELMVVPCLNPDGLVRGTRENALGIDLNRDHQLLDSPEVCALHRLSRDFLPDLIIDVHTYPPRRRALVAHGLEIGEDVMLETHNHPASLRGYAARWRALIAPTLDALAEGGIRAARYWVVRPVGPIRSSSPDVVDARNGLSARLGVPAVLIEGREPTRRFGSVERTRSSLRQAIVHTLETFCRADLDPETPARRIALEARRRAGPPPVLRTLGPGDRDPTVRPVPGRTLPELVPRRWVRRPLAYAVSGEHDEILSLLERHGFSASVLDRRARSRQPLGDAPIVHARVRGSKHLDPDARLFFTDVRGGELLTAMLEPESPYGLFRHDRFGGSLEPGSRYPVTPVFARPPRTNP